MQEFTFNNLYLVMIGISVVAVGARVVYCLIRMIFGMDDGAQQRARIIHAIIYLVIVVAIIPIIKELWGVFYTGSFQWFK